jgi:hypothetical protein
MNTKSGKIAAAAIINPRSEGSLIICIFAAIFLVSTIEREAGRKKVSTLRVEICIGARRW